MQSIPNTLILDDFETLDHHPETRSLACWQVIPRRAIQRWVKASKTPVRVDTHAQVLATVTASNGQPVQLPCELVKQHVGGRSFDLRVLNSGQVLQDVDRKFVSVRP